MTMPLFNMIKLVLGFTGFLVSASVNAQLAVDPPEPVAGSMVKIVGISGCMGNWMDYSVVWAANKNLDTVIKIIDPGYIDAGLLPCPVSKKNRIVVGPLIEGSYVVERYFRASTGAGPLQDSVRFRVTAASNQYFPPDWTGFWWSPTEPGWAISVDRDPATGHIFAVWYTHVLDAATQRPRDTWFVAPNLSLTGVGAPSDFPQLARVVSGDVYVANGSRSLFPANTPLSAFSFTGAKIGSISMTFLSYTEARLEWTLNMTGDSIDQSASARPRSGSVSLRKFTY
jgi:hypothetical protein